MEKNWGLLCTVRPLYHPGRTATLPKTYKPPSLYTAKQSRHWTVIAGYGSSTNLGRNPRGGCWKFSQTRRFSPILRMQMRCAHLHVHEASFQLTTVAAGIMPVLTGIARAPCSLELLHDLSVVREYSRTTGDSLSPMPVFLTGFPKRAKIHY